MPRLAVFLAAQAWQGDQNESADACENRLNDMEGSTKIVETGRERSAVYFDLVELVHRTNRRAKRTKLRASLHLTEELITIHFYTTAVFAIAVAFNAELYAAGKPIHDCESIIWGRKGGAT